MDLVGGHMPVSEWNSLRPVPTALASPSPAGWISSGYQKKQGEDTQQGPNTPALNAIPPLATAHHVFKQCIHFGCQEIVLSRGW